MNHQTKLWQVWVCIVRPGRRHTAYHRGHTTISQQSPEIFVGDGVLFTNVNLARLILKIDDTLRQLRIVTSIPWSTQLLGTVLLEVILWY